jgi:hypothetical protein
MVWEKYHRNPKLCARWPMDSHPMSKREKSRCSKKDIELSLDKMEEDINDLADKKNKFFEAWGVQAEFIKKYFSGFERQIDLWSSLRDHKDGDDATGSYWGQMMDGAEFVQKPYQIRDIMDQATAYKGDTIVFQPEELESLQESKKTIVKVVNMAKKYPTVKATPCEKVDLPPEAEELAKKIEDKLAQMTSKAIKAKLGPNSTLQNLEIEVETLIKELKVRIKKSLEEEKDNPWAICTASVGRDDKKKYERCVLSVKKKKK